MISWSAFICFPYPALLLLLTTWTKVVGSNFSIVAPFVDAVPAKAVNLKQGIDWNYDLRWDARQQWDVEHTMCWGVDFSQYYNVSVYSKWEACRVTSAYLNSKTPPEKHLYETATCAYIKCALHWTGWVNDDYSLNEARGENMAQDLMTGIKQTVFSKYMLEYRKCANLFRFPFDSWCTENLEFARCHIQAFNIMCDAQIDKRVPFPRPPPSWAKKVRKRSTTFESNNTNGTVDSSGSTGGEDLPVELMEASEGITIDKRSAGKPTRKPWLTVGHFCTDICHSACSFNENLYQR